MTDTLIKIKISADSTADLSSELVERYDILVTPLTVTMGDEAFKDGIDATPETIFAHVAETGKLPQTSAGNVDEYISAFRPFVEQGMEIVHISLSSCISSAYQNASIAAEELGHVHVIDSLDLSGAQALLTLKCADLAAEGLSAEKIVEAALEYRAKLDSSFIIDKLDYMHRGGRCSAVAALGANVLKLKPCIRMEEGKLIPAKKYRGPLERVLLQYVEDSLKGRTDVDSSRIAIAYTVVPQKTVDAVKDAIRSFCPDVGELLDLPNGCTVATHCGPGTLGLFFATK